VAKAEMKAYGIPASITLAQGILESGMGYGRLATEAIGKGNVSVFIKTQQTPIETTPYF